MIFDLVAARTTGVFPISIATSIAIESLLGLITDDDSKVIGNNPKPPIDEIDELWINIDTLFRNLTGAMGGNAFLEVRENALTQELLNEMSRIRQLLENNNRPVTTVFYACGHQDLTSKYPNAKHRIARTDKQHIVKNLTDRVRTEVIEALKDTDSPVLEFRNGLELRSQRRVMLLSHHTIDLLNYINVATLTLLESHTGAIKTRAQWHTKFYNGAELDRIPFNASMLCIFGDTEHFSPQSNQVRRTVLDLALENRWTVLTTRDKIIYNVSRITDPILRKTIQDLLV